MDTQEPVFDNVKFEKAKAMARYSRFRKITKLLQFLKVSVVVMLISWSSTRLPGALKISGRFLGDVADLFNPHVVFVIGNVIIVALFVLCRERSAGGESESSGDGDFYDDYVRHSEAHAQREKVQKNPAPEPPAAPEIKEVIAGNAGDGGDEAEEKQIVVCSETEEKAEQCEAVTTAIETATKQIEKFQRTQSVKLKSEIAAKPRGELRRSETVKVGRGRTEMLKMTSVDKLSNEEFNMTIEAVIKRHQEFLMEQKLAEI